MTKTESVTLFLKARIESGVYGSDPLPPERILCEELGVSRTILRLSIDALLLEGVLEKTEAQKLRCANRTPHSLNIAFLKPHSSVRAYDQLFNPLVRVAKKHSANLRIEYYINEYDPSIRKVFTNYDGVFFVPPNEYIAPVLLELLTEYNSKVFVYDHDLSYNQIYSIIPYPPQHIPALLNLLPESDKVVDCVSSRSGNNSPIFNERTGQWQIWIDSLGRGGTLHQYEVAPNESVEGSISKLIKDLYRKNKLPDALFFTSEHPAMIAMRTLLDLKVNIPNDIRIVALSDLGFCRVLNPLLTSLEISDPTPFLEHSLQYILSDKKNRLPRSMLSQVPQIFIGETHLAKIEKKSR